MALHALLQVTSSLMAEHLDRVKRRNIHTVLPSENLLLVATATPRGVHED